MGNRQARKKQSTRYVKKNSSTTPPSDREYRKVIVQGLLTTKSDFHTGTGLSDSYTQDGVDGREGGFSENLICKDVNGNPIIHASTLRGYLRQQLNDTEDILMWFGGANNDKDEAGSGQIGALRFYDATCQTDCVLSRVSRTKIDDVTGTAKKHNLSTHQVVPASTQFTFEIHLDRTTRRLTTLDIRYLMGLLEKLNGSRLGNAKSIGHGLFTWEQTQVSGLSENEFLAWLNRDVKIKANYAKAFKSIEDLAPLALTSNDNQWHVMEYTLNTGSPLLIGDPHHPSKQGSTTITSDLPNHVYMEKKGRAVIPGSTFKGWWRAQCRRILMTYSQGHFASEIDVMLDRLFGGPLSGQSLMRFNDATVDSTLVQKHKQIFNAVDRFSGGVKQSALYRVEGLQTAPDGNNPFNVSMECQLERLEGWMKLLILFVWRDMKQGDLVLGWGRAKGFGRLAVTCKNEPSWLQVPDDEETILAWEHELRDQTPFITQGQVA